jgi:uncharacterized protein (DUF2062 family)
MLFKRRTETAFVERLRLLLWPRRSFWRSAKYFAKRALRLQATPHAIAAGVAAGIFVSFVPTPGFHFLLAALIAWCIAGNVVASAIGTAVGNPLTFPLIWGATYEVGRFILYGTAIDDVRPLNLVAALKHLDLYQLWEPLLKPMTVGAIPIGLVAAAVAYVVTRWGVAQFHERRRARFAAKAARTAGSAGRPTMSVRT